MTQPMKQKQQRKEKQRHLRTTLRRENGKQPRLIFNNFGTRKQIPRQLTQKWRREAVLQRNYDGVLAYTAALSPLHKYVQRKASTIIWCKM